MFQKSTISWKEAASSIVWNIQPFIDGRYRPSASGEFLKNINPVDEAILCELPAGDAVDIDAAVRTARKCFDAGCWSELSPTSRADVIFKLANLIAEHQRELALLDTMEMGKPIQAALHDVGVFSTSILRAFGGFADKLVGNSAPFSGRTLSFNTYQPRGVVGAITPWNFPAVNVIAKIAPALAAGNAVVLKPSEWSSSSALKIAELALEAGLPQGILNVVPGAGYKVGAALALHPDVDLISFTGSTLTGRKVMELAGKSNAKPLLLECGGKSPQLVFDDIDDIDRVAEGVVQSALWNQGQVCSARTRLIVHERIKDALLDRVIERASRHKPGHPLDESTTFGPLANPVQRDRVKTYIDQGLKAGAYPVLRGSIQEQGGCFVSPTIFDQVDSQMSIMREEIFGPVICVQGFSSEAEAIHLANDSEYGLGATIWTKGVGRAKRLAHAVKAGSVLIRTSGQEDPELAYSLSYEPQKSSGFGSEIGLKGLESYSALKLVTLSGA